MGVHKRHVVFEPLRIVHKDFHALAGVEILDLNNGFIAAGVTQWVVVHLNKSVDVVHIALGVLDPVDVVQLPLLEVTRFVVGDEVAKRSGLLVVFSV